MSSLAKRLITSLISNQETLSIAESCTGGLVSAYLTAIPGASKAFKGGYIVYSDEMKQTLLHVPEQLLSTDGAVSEKVAEFLAKECQKRANSTYGLSIVGFLGPTGGTKEHPCGTIIVSIAHKNSLHTTKTSVTGPRAIRQKKAAKFALFLLAEKLFLE